MLTNIVGSLSLIVWLPIVFGMLVLVVGGGGRERISRWIALLGSVLGALVVIPLWLRFDRTEATFQFVEFSPWIDIFNINYHLGIDGISLILILLNVGTTIFVVVGRRQGI